MINKNFYASYIFIKKKAQDKEKPGLSMLCIYALVEIFLCCEHQCSIAASGFD